MAKDNSSGKIIAKAALTLLTHAIVPLAWLILAGFIMPIYLDAVGRMDVELPAITRCSIAAAQLIRRFWYVFAPGLVLFLGLDFAIITSLARTGRPMLARLWSMLVIFVQCTISGVAIVALYLPIIAPVMYMQ